MGSSTRVNPMPAATLSASRPMRRSRSHSAACGATTSSAKRRAWAISSAGHAVIEVCIRGVSVDGQREHPQQPIL